MVFFLSGKGVQRKFRNLVQDLLIKFKAEDTVAYHDMNDDMKVSRQESVEQLLTKL